MHLNDFVFPILWQFLSGLIRVVRLLMPFSGNLNGYAIPGDGGRFQIAHSLATDIGLHVKLLSHVTFIIVS